MSAWVPHHLHRKVQEAAKAAGISMAMYLATLIERDELDEDGVPLWHQTTDQLQEELPIKNAS